MTSMQTDDTRVHECNANRTLRSVNKQSHSTKKVKCNWIEMCKVKNGFQKRRSYLTSVHSCPRSEW